MAQEHIVKLYKPYEFEGKTYNEIDLSRIDDLTTEDLTEAERSFTRSGGMATVLEVNIQFAMHVAVRATNLPVEFFQRLPARDMLKVKNMLIANFFADGD